MIRLRRPVGGLRLRLVASFTAVALLGSVVASGIAYHLVRQAMLQRVQDSALTDFKSTLARMVPPQLPPGTGLALEIQEKLAVPDSRYASVGEMVPGATGEELGPGILPSQRFLIEAEDGPVFQRVIHRGTPYLLMATRVVVATPGEVQASPIFAVLAVDLGREAADLRSFSRAVLIADGVALVAALALALLAARGVLRPVRRLGAAARALGEGQLATRVRVQGRDELADLAQTFNSTAEALERTVTELSEMEKASRRFVADVSHELRTPLTAMVAVTDVLAEETAASADGSTAAALVVAETQRLRQLVEHLIEISRFDAGAAALVLDDVVIAEAVTSTLTARGWADTVDVAGPPELTARLDPRRFDVIVANLVGNAIRHGRPPVRLRYGAAGSEQAPEFELVVTDDGSGIPEELLDLVFDRFVKADSARARSEGSGLGLSIAQANAELHGGSLAAANSAAWGAVFTLRLPLEQEER